jgi:hypothetical protein
MNFVELIMSNELAGILVKSEFIIIVILIAGWKIYSIVVNHKFNKEDKLHSENFKDSFVYRGKYLGYMEIYAKEIDNLMCIIKNKKPSQYKLLNQQVQNVLTVYRKLNPKTDDISTFSAVAEHMTSMIITLCYIVDMNIPAYIENDNVNISDNTEEKKKPSLFNLSKENETGSVLNMPSNESMKELGKKFSREFLIQDEEVDDVNFSDEL